MSVIDNFMNLFVPPAPIDPLPPEKVKQTYFKERIKIFIGIFVGYSAAYLVRKNISLAIPYLVREGLYTKSQLSWGLTAISVAYGFSKFVMGNVSDRSNPRYFLAMGLLVSVIVAFLFGCSSWAYSSLGVIIILMAINGWAQGMTYPPCVRVLAHWYTVKERNVTMTLWNLSQNVGAFLLGPLALLGVGLFHTWHALFTLPAFIALVCFGLVIFLVRDTPQSVGLPSIEEFRGERVEVKANQSEKELSAKEIFFQHIFNNKAVWYLAFANIFVYFVRYGVLDWAPIYLSEVKGFDFKSQGWAYFYYEFAGMFSVLLCGWLSGRYFKSRRTPLVIISMILVTFSVMLYWLNPPGRVWVDNIALALVGFLIYGPVVLIGMQAVDVVNKKAVGTATGLIGLFGYMLGTVGANALMGHVVEHFGWDAGFYMLIASCVLSVIFLLPIRNAGGEK